MKKTIKRGFLVTICLLSLLLCSCEAQQQENRDRKEEQKSEEKVTQGLVMEGRTDDGVTYQYNKITAVLTVSGKTIKGADSMDDLEKIPWGKWRDEAKELVLEEGVECVTDRAFMDFRRLERIVFPNTLRKIDNYAFYDSIREFKKLDLPDSLEEIGQCALAQEYSYKGPEEIRLSKNLRSIGKEAFCSQSVIRITIPENVETVGDKAFEGCTRMEIADIKANNVKIGKEVFAECGELKKVVLNTKKIKEIGKNLFFNVFHDVNVFVPKEKVKEYQKMLSRSMYAKVKAMK